MAARIRRVAETTRIGDYREGDAPEIARVFYKTVRLVNRADYPDEQIEAWAPGVPDPEEWHTRLAGRRTLGVCCEDVMPTEPLSGPVVCPTAG